jgi:ribosomal protein S18 acetylase RimI-like enzyme
VRDTVPTSPRVRTADQEDIAAVIAILAESSAWLRAKGILQWPDRFPEAVISGAMDSGDLYVAMERNEIVATVTLQWRDPSFWGERNDAAFVHRLAVRRSHAGIGQRLLRWAANQARSRDRSYLCLDCLSSNERLRRYYEDLGFRRVKEISGPSNHPHSAAHGAWSAVLYEKALYEDAIP